MPGKYRWQFVSLSKLTNCRVTVHNPTRLTASLRRPAFLKIALCAPWGRAHVAKTAFARCTAWYSPAQGHSQSDAESPVTAIHRLLVTLPSAIAAR
jgi:hypothetical protein